MGRGTLTVVAWKRHIVVEQVTAGDGAAAGIAVLRLGQLSQGKESHY